MDLKQYERAKFELSAILRPFTLGAEHKDREISQSIDSLFGRLAEDRFNLVVVGRFSRGKTSLMNALLETERLPMSIVPLTSVITTVAYGTKECVFIEYEGQRLSNEIPLASLAEYITQQGNPGNSRHVAMARVELPAEFLRRGFYFVDTPGLGSTIIENTRTTERFLPEADAFVLVTSYDSPLSSEELAILRNVASSGHPVFLVLNKRDLASAGEQAAALDHVQSEVRRVGAGGVRVYSISAREALEARRTNDPVLLKASGLPELREELVEFLLREKQTQFLLRMCSRVSDLLRQIPGSLEAAQQLRELEKRLTQYAPVTGVASRSPSMPADPAPLFASCGICDRLDREMFEFLSQYQYDVLVSHDFQAKLARRRGLCEFHIWKYASIASPRGTCVGFSGVLEQLAAQLRQVSVGDSTAMATQLEALRPEDCDLCQARTRLERAAVEAAVQRLTSDRSYARRFPGVCMLHLRMLARRVSDAKLLAKLLANQAAAMERVSEDMRRYALKHEGVRRFLVTTEEGAADQRALVLLGGLRTVNGG